MHVFVKIILTTQSSGSVHSIILLTNVNFLVCVLTMYNEFACKKTRCETVAVGIFSKYFLIEIF